MSDPSGALGADYPTPAHRRFRVYALDPLAAASAHTSGISETVISLPWEEPFEEPLSLGPSGEYLEVIDFDPAVGLFYAPLDPNDVRLVAQDGLPPSESVPQFHQQMVYAVAMRTIRNFERALGRRVLWSERKDPNRRNGKRDPDHGFVQKLRIYPHALREANAYYSPQKKALLFGYFRATPTPLASSIPDAWTFTCLSHDIIAHETAHAILDGVHARFIEPSGLDGLAFHEAFSDIVSLLQRFTLPLVVEHALTASRGRIDVAGLLSGLARQFGDATGRAGALRDAIGQEGTNPEKLSDTLSQPHARGAVLVAALFDALVTIFERRTADLIRIAAVDSDIGREALHPDLVRRLANEACKSADHLLRICVRALDYVPPFDITFGDYLRAMITADADLVADDPYRYRQALAEAFRKRDIYPRDVMSMVPESLLWLRPEIWDAELAQLSFNDLVPKLDASPKTTRRELWHQARRNRIAVHRWLNEPDDYTAQWERLLGVCLTQAGPVTISRSQDGFPKVEVHSVRLAERLGPDGATRRDWVIEITQGRDAWLDPETQRRADAGEAVSPRDFRFLGGATLLVDQLSGRVRYVIRKRVDDDRRLDAQRRYLAGASEVGTEGIYIGPDVTEPFALLHRH